MSGFRTEQRPNSGDGGEQSRARPRQVWTFLSVISFSWLSVWNLLYLNLRVDVQQTPCLALSSRFGLSLNIIYIQISKFFEISNSLLCSFRQTKFCWGAPCKTGGAANHIHIYLWLTLGSINTRAHKLAEIQASWKLVCVVMNMMEWSEDGAGANICAYILNGGPREIDMWGGGR